MGTHHRRASTSKRNHSTATVLRGPVSRASLFSHGLDEGFGIADEIVVADVIQVGAGSAGCPYAKLRTDDRCVSLHLIESGRRQLDNPIIQQVADTLPVDFAAEYHHFYPADPQPFTPPQHNPPFFSYTKGNGWGGGGVHYYLLMVRGTPALYDSWAAISGDPLWNYESVLPSMRVLEEYVTFGLAPINTEERGVAGPLTISLIPLTDPANGFVASLAVAGVVYSPDYNDPSQGVYVAGNIQQSAEYAGPFELEGIRQYGASAFLNTDVVKVDANGDGLGVGGRQLFIDSEAYAIKLLFEDDFDAEELAAIDQEFGLGWSSQRCSRIPASLTVRGVRYMAGDRVVDALARERVILCASSIGDVEILQRSGIGPAALLEEIGVTLRLDQPNVGRNLQNHFGTIVALPPGADPPALLTVFLPGAGSGADGIRQYQLIGGTGFFGDENIGFLAVDLQPAANGTVELRTRAFPGTMQIRFNPLTDPTDQQDAVDFLKTLGRISIANAGALTVLPPPELYPNDAEFGPYGGLATDDSALLAYYLATGTFLNHDAGTVRMSTSAETGVVDGKLDVWGVANLSIADSGVIPNIADGNTALSCFTVGMQKAKIDGAPVTF